MEKLKLMGVQRRRTFELALERWNSFICSWVNVAMNLIESGADDRLDNEVYGTRVGQQVLRVKTDDGRWAM